jgi:hypothetical protein
MRCNRRGQFRLATFSAFVASVIASPAQAAERNFLAGLLVNCTTISIASALVGSGPVMIVVQGTCHENVVVTRDDVTITTDRVNRATIQAVDSTQPVIFLDDARRAVIDGIIPNGITVSGGTSRARPSTRSAASSPTPSASSTASPAPPPASPSPWGKQDPSPRRGEGRVRGRSSGG